MMTQCINNYRARKIGTHHLVTTDHGSHILLTEKQFSLFRNGKIDPLLKQELIKKEILLDESNISEAERELRLKYNFLRKGTSLHIIVPTLRCNMNCIYCQASSVPEKSKGYDMDDETARKTVDTIFQSPSTHITIEFQGGEPLLAWNTVKTITAYAKERKKDKDLRITIVTNLTEMSEDKMTWLIDQDVIVCSSLDGPKELHDKNRPHSKGSNHETVTRWVKRFRQEYAKRGIRRNLECLPTITKQSLSQPKEIVDEYVRLGLSSIHLRYLNGMGVAKSAWNHISYTADQYLNFWREAVEHIDTLNASGKKISERMVDLIIRKMNDPEDPNFMDLRSPCGAAIGQLLYNHNGDIYTCDEGRMIGEDLFILGNVATDSYKDTVTCDNACAIIQASMNDQYMCDSCAYKPYCGICPVVNYAETGNITCAVTATDRCKILMAQFDWVVKQKYIKHKMKTQ